MKLKPILLCALFCAGVTTGFSQSNAIKINILSPILNTINLSYEHALNESSSLQLGFYYTGVKISDLKYAGFGITPEYRFYLSETPAPDGVYLAPFVRYQSVKLTETTSTYEANLTAIGGGVIIGKQWLFKQKITLDIFLGPSYNSGSTEVKDTGNGSGDVSVSGAFDGFGLRAGITLGLAF